jgi:hypothetical protein
MLFDASPLNKKNRCGWTIGAMQRESLESCLLLVTFSQCFQCEPSLCLMTHLCTRDRMDSDKILSFFWMLLLMEVNRCVTLESA